MVNPGRILGRDRVPRGRPRSGAKKTKHVFGSPFEFGKWGYMAGYGLIQGVWGYGVMGLCEIMGLLCYGGLWGFMGFDRDSREIPPRFKGIQKDSTGASLGASPKGASKACSKGSKGAPRVLQGRSGAPRGILGETLFLERV